MEEWPREKCERKKVKMMEENDLNPKKVRTKRYADRQIMCVAG